MKREIPLSVPNLNHDIIRNLTECIETGWVSTGGRFIAEFESKFAKYVGMDAAVSTQSGTAGLHLALKVLGIEAGDEVIVPTLTFLAAINPVAYLGAKPVFMDCDDSLCIDVDKLEQFLEDECEKEPQGFLRNKKSGGIVKAIVAVHVFGNLCNMERLMSIASKYDLKVLEDSTEALGTYVKEGRYKGKYAGTIGDIGVYSFNANKIITTGGGGMIVSNHAELLEKMRYLSLTAKDDSLFFLHNEVGFNYRMLNIQAAIGVSQIDELENFIRIKKNNYELYKKMLSDVRGISLIPFRHTIRENCWFYSFLIEEDILGISRDRLMHCLIDEGIQCRPVWKLNHTQKPYATCTAFRIENAQYYESHILNLPCSSGLSEEDVIYICDKIKRICCH